MQARRIEWEPKVGMKVRKIGGNPEYYPIGYVGIISEVVGTEKDCFTIVRDHKEMRYAPWYLCQKSVWEPVRTVEIVDKEYEDLFV